MLLHYSLYLGTVSFLLGPATMATGNRQEGYIGQICSHVQLVTVLASNASKCHLISHLQRAVKQGIME